MSKELYQKEVKILNDEAEEIESRIKANSMFDETIRREWDRFEKYKKGILNLDTDNLTNGDIKSVFNKIYVGVAGDKKKRYPQKYLIFSYSIIGYSIEEIIQMYYDKGYADENTKINITLNSNN